MKKWADATKAARKALGLVGFVPVVEWLDHRMRRTSRSHEALPMLEQRSRGFFWSKGAQVPFAYKDVNVSL